MSEYKFPTQEELSKFRELTTKKYPTEGELDELAPKTQLSFEDPTARRFGIDGSTYPFQLKVHGDNDRMRAEQQSALDQFGNAVGRVALNVIPTIVGNLASAADLEDYYNTDDEVGNWLTTSMEGLKEKTNEMLPIYRTDPGKALDVGDFGWWAENGSA